MHSRMDTTPLGIRLYAEPLALLKVGFVVANADLSVEDLQIELSFLRHLGVDTKTLLQDLHDLFDGTDCTFSLWEVGSCKRRRVGRLILFRLNRLSQIDSSDVTQNKIKETAIDYNRVRIRFLALVFLTRLIQIRLKM